MNLLKKKKLAARTFNVGKERIVFIESRKNEINEAITKQDIRDLKESGAIIIKEIKGRRRKKVKRGSGPGKIKKKVNKRKGKYVALSRKLRRHLSGLKREGKISNEQFKEMRKRIKNSFFKSKSHLKSYINPIKSK